MAIVIRYSRNLFSLCHTDDRQDATGKETEVSALRALVSWKAGVAAK